jgi:hypothetical protein
MASKLPAFVVLEGKRKAVGSQIFGIPLEDLTKEDLITVLGYFHGKREVSVCVDFYGNYKTNNQTEQVKLEIPPFIAVPEPRDKPKQSWWQSLWKPSKPFI